MKKMSKMGKSILLSSLAIIAFGGIAAGTTYALFTSDATTSVSVTTGKVNVSSAIEFSSATTLNGDKVESISLDDNNTGNTSKSITFGCGATATIGEKGVVSLSNFVSGDTVTIKVTAKNESTVNVKYRAVVTMDTSLANIFTLTGKVGENNMLVSDDGIFTQYKEAKAVKNANIAEDLDTYYITLGIGTDKDVKDGTQTTGSVTIKIDAIQGNATGTNKTERVTVTKPEDLKTALTSNSVDVANKVIEVPETINLTDTLTVSNTNAEIVLSPSAKIEAPTDKPAFNVTSGTVTLSVATVSGETGVKPRNRYLVNAANDTDTTPIITSAKNAIIADGKGSKVIIDGVKIVSTGASAIVAKNGGEVVVKGGEVEAQEVAVLVYGGSTATIDNGTFTTTDNFVVGTNGTKGWGGNTITINGGVFNGNIQSKNYIACGVYVANSDTVNINGGTFNIKDGCGVLARSGKTTVSDSVKFEFSSSSEDANEKITDGWVGDTKILVPTGKAVVKDLIASYPGGAPTATYSGTEGVTELKSIDVTCETEFTNAISNTEVPKNIYIKNNITLSSRVTIQSKNTIIYGDGNVNITTSDSRVFNVFGDNDNGSYPIVNNGSLTLSGVNIEAKDDTARDYSRAINLYWTENYTLNLDKAGIKVGHYGINLASNNKNLRISAKNSTITAYGCLNVYDGNNTVTASFNKCVLNGENVYEKAQPSNNFANINIGTGGNNLSFNNCTFNMNSVNGNIQRIITVYKNDNTVTMNGCKFYSINSTGTTEVKTTDVDFVKTYLNTASTITIDGDEFISADNN